MKLRNIALTSIFILVLVAMATEFTVSHLIVQDGFNNLERQQVETDVQRVKNEIAREAEGLDTFLWDWASWDDTYNFVQTGNPEYLKSNLPIGTFLDQNLNLVIIRDNAGTDVYAKAVNADEEFDPQLVRDFNSLTRGVELPERAEEAGRGGIVLINDVPFIFFTRPILTSEEDLPSIGTMIMGRFLSSEIVEAIAARMEITLSIHPTSIEHQNERSVKRELATGLKAVVIAQNADIINGYGVVEDITGQPALMIEISEPRHIAAHGRSVAMYNTLFLAALLLVFNAMLYFLIQYRVISRVERLNSQVREVDLESETAMRVNTDGDDELSQLGTNINAMLQRLALDQKKLHEAHDLLEAKVAERTLELEEANVELQCLDKAKSQFLSSTSHELRTPLTAILGFIKLMERTFRKHFQPHLNNVDEATQRMGTFLENFKIVRKETDRLGRLINDLLDLNKIEAGRVEWRDTDVDVSKLVRHVGDTMAGQFNDLPAVDFFVVTSPDLPSLHIDEDRLHQVLANLVNNAAKFTDEGIVRLSVRQTKDNMLEFSVEDSGPGIREEDVERIFDTFYQSQHDWERPGTSLGTGLGLAICKEIIEHYNGSIWVESRRGEGSNFKFKLPLP
ncbi:CHASE4 domain-containing protein [Pseudodesulfovibrio sp. zrk46]|uniref:sensor histidine kinase n=1 Tax=Pseudodesulfovibrio sp. zrk46 TaxID=2725288 RepID=UPI00144909E8|nr:CHASE4 domain-containing protein [Pseudodesulfovibrio sp. zrk46]QJB55495.1 HAMP domain-containing protein [Pseudodesulfovibrio sp. zrk46]